MCRLSLAAVLAVVALAAGRTTVEFSRRGFTCDQFGDRPFDGTTKIVYAYGDEDPHWNKPDIDLNTAAAFGQTFMHLQTAPWPDPPEDDTKTAAFLASHYTVPYEERHLTDVSTVWMSMGLDAFDVIPDCDEDHPVHVTKWEVAIEEGHIEWVHHIDLQGCHYDLEPDALEQSGWDETLVGPRLAPSLQQCWFNYAALWTWLLSGAPIVYPPEAGVRFGGPSDNGYSVRYVNLEMHYDMPWYQPPPGETVDTWQPDHLFTDNSGVRVYYTSILRPYDIGQMWIGVDVGTTFVLPPGQADYLSRGMTMSDSLDPYEEGHVPEDRNAMWPKGDEVKFVSMNMHMHDQGRRGYARHVRDGVELPWIVSDTHYNDYYQQYLSAPRVFKAGDTVFLDCHSNTEMYHKNSFGNLATDEQMCFLITNFYPSFNPKAPPQLAQDQRNAARDTFHNRFANVTQVFDPDFEKWEPPVKCAKTDGAHPHPAFGDSDPAPLHHFDAAKYDIHIHLDTAKKVQLHWSYDMDNDIADFALEVDTDGWVAFGIAGDNDAWSGKSDFHQVHGEVLRDSLAPGMPNSDIMFSWVDDDTGEPFFSDNYADGMSMTHVDTFQDYFRIKAKQDGVTYIRK